MAIGIDVTARHAIDLGFIPIIVEDACGFGDEAAASRAVEHLRFGGDTIFTTVDDVVHTLESTR
jgi:nicotinamidase-related amidase